MNTCRSCVYWSFTSVIAKIPTGECKCPKLVHATQIKSADELAYTDTDNFQAWLSTGPDFGCVHHKGADEI